MVLPILGDAYNAKTRLAPHLNNFNEISLWLSMSIYSTKIV